jgi:hypothetical protein
MRLLQLRSEKTITIHDFHSDFNTPPYAILSHTWGSDQDEVTFKDVVEGTGRGKVGWKKLEFCGERARMDGLEWFWVDTCM